MGRTGEVDDGGVEGPVPSLTALGLVDDEPVVGVVEWPEVDDDDLPVVDDEPVVGVVEWPEVDDDDLPVVDDEPVVGVVEWPEVDDELVVGVDTVTTTGIDSVALLLVTMVVPSYAWATAVSLTSPSVMSVLVTLNVPVQTSSAPTARELLLLLQVGPVERLSPLTDCLSLTVKPVKFTLPLFVTTKS
jgi:hypothetical protein